MPDSESAMNTPAVPPRRRLLQAAVAAAAGQLISCGRARSSWRFFTAAEARTVHTITERLIPADQDPGAAWAGVVHYIDRQLTRRFKEFQRHYREGLAAVDRTAQRLHARPFLELSESEQISLLAALEKNDAPPGTWTAVEPREFFELILAHTIQGFYGSPRHGGNRDAVSWRMLGVPDPPVRGRLHYELPPPREKA